MSKVKPLSPDDVEKGRKSQIPDFIIEAVNNLLLRELHNGSATLRQDEVMKEVMKLAPKGTKRDDIYDKNWLDFEETFQDVGWSVTYDKPGYCEDYEPTWKFKNKRKHESY